MSGTGTSSRTVRAAGVLGVSATLLLAACDREPAPADTQDLALVMGWTDPVAHLESPDHDVRLQAIRDLSSADDPVVVPHLIRALEDPDFRIRREAADGLRRHAEQAEDAVPALAVALDDPSAIVRARARNALSAIGGPRAAGALRDHLRTIDTAHIDEVLVALGSAGHPGAIDDVVPYLEHEDPFVRRAALVALIRIGERAAPTLRRLLDHDAPAMRCEAARALAILADRGALDQLRAMGREDDDARAASCALGAAGRLGDADAVATLVDQLATGTLDVRTRAADALAIVATVEVVAPLADALTSFPATPDHPNPALRALIELGPVAAPELVTRTATARGEELALLARVLATTARPGDQPALERALDRATTDVARAALMDAIQAVAIRSGEPPPRFDRPSVEGSGADEGSGSAAGPG